MYTLVDRYDGNPRYKGYKERRRGRKIVDEPGVRFLSKDPEVHSTHCCWIVGFGLILLHTKACNADGRCYWGALNESTTGLRAEGSCTSIRELHLTRVALGCVQIPSSRLNLRQLFHDALGPAGKFVVLQGQQLETTEFNKVFCIDFIVWCYEFYMLT